MDDEVKCCGTCRHIQSVDDDGQGWCSASSKMPLAEFMRGGFPLVYVDRGTECPCYERREES
jgi:hypothetical protein